MKAQIIWRTSIATTTEAEDAVSEILATHIAPSPSAYTDVETGVTTVSVYSTQPPKRFAQAKAAMRDALAELKRFGINIGTGRINSVELPRENWADSWKRHFPALEIGHALLVKPSWIKRALRPGQRLVVLDPGLSFGTGQHPTTGFCLQEIARVIPPARTRSVRRTRTLSFLDMGTGSGILAIAAAKLGFGPIHAFDYDPQCVKVSRANARSNRVEHKIRITQADLTRLPKRAAKQYDFVCANILANLLISERDRILSRVKKSGRLVLAGILSREFHEVQAAYETAGWRLVASKVEKEWRSGAFVHRSIEDAEIDSENHFYGARTVTRPQR